MSEVLSARRIFEVTPERIRDGRHRLAGSRGRAMIPSRLGARLTDMDVDRPTADRRGEHPLRIGDRPEALRPIPIPGLSRTPIRARLLRSVSARDTTRTIRSMQSLAGRPGTDVVTDAIDRARLGKHPREPGCEFSAFRGPCTAVRHNFNALADFSSGECTEESPRDRCAWGIARGCGLFVTCRAMSAWRSGGRRWASAG